ncbi:MAG: bifunctional (p)ppGpp synthetase/guanosine-3',5'-bis(diphosphate) 3'-pyrophosphohydrolase [Paludibacteraceae bacterium]|nr:bifunctional (p)ppGpp synthetase/guanosine-3',5'-bis(diphosphate) 3'-pyrophosphohydrolase [Paludibacteraceae bacterium]
MEKDNYFTKAEQQELVHLYWRILHATGGQMSAQDLRQIQDLLRQTIDRKRKDEICQEKLNPIIKDLNTVYLTVSEIGMGRATVLSVLVFEALREGVMQEPDVEPRFGRDVAVIVRGLLKAHELYRKNVAIESENFRKLLLTFAEDIRVVFILIAEHVYIMRNLEKYDEDQRHRIARESAYLYAPMAHRMGLYKMKTELEDLSLKWLSPDIYNEISARLTETKDVREKYIADFIAPLREQLRQAGFDFEIKGRTKSIYSIWNKIKKKGTPFENIYDIFAVRVILNSVPEREKADCWQVYSIVTDKYQPNPKRLRDWLSIPKSNGYESLHTTVMGPEGRWVEVQIRTRRMDEIAVKGLAAHWKYKGIKSEQGMEDWLKNLREILENPEKNAVDFMDDFRLDLYDDDVFVFTPGGELKKLKQGSTVLDFAFNIHSAIGCRCVGAKVNGKNVPIRHVLSNGDQVEVLTSQNQMPKSSWLEYVVTGKAKTKIKQVLRELATKDAELGKEMLERKLRNWKVEYEESDYMRSIRKAGFKTVTEFYQGVAHGTVDLQRFREMIETERQTSSEQPTEHSAAEFIHADLNEEMEIGKHGVSDDVLVIDKDLTGIEYKLAKCCNPIYGDKVFGFVSALGGIKIHRVTCPNAPQMISRYGYRVVKARWSGKGGSQYAVSLRVTGKDDIGIVTNISSLISKHPKVTLRSISVDSGDGVFSGQVTVLVSNLADCEELVRRIEAIRGVTGVTREG